MEMSWWRIISKNPEQQIILELLLGLGMGKWLLIIVNFGGGGGGGLRNLQYNIATSLV